MCEFTREWQALVYIIMNFYPFCDQTQELDSFKYSHRGISIDREKEPLSSFSSGMDSIKELALGGFVSYTLEALKLNVTQQTMTHFVETEAVYVPMLHVNLHVHE